MEFIAVQPEELHVALAHPFVQLVKPGVYTHEPAVQVPLDG